MPHAGKHCFCIALVGLLTTLDKPARRNQVIANDFRICQCQVFEVRHVLAQPGFDRGNGVLHQPVFRVGLRHFGQHFFGCCQAVYVLDTAQPVLFDLGIDLIFAGYVDLSEDRRQRFAKQAAQAGMSQHLMEQDAGRILWRPEL